MAFLFLTVVFVVHVDVVDEFWVEPEESFGQVSVQSCRVQKTKVQNSLANSPPHVHVPNYVSVLLWVYQNINFTNVSDLYDLQV